MVHFFNLGVRYVFSTLNIFLADSTLENDLSYVEMTVFDQIECQAYYGSQLEDTMICTVGTTNQGTCYVGNILCIS